MFHSNEFNAELETLKNDVSLLLHTAKDGVFHTSETKAEALAEQIKAALKELGETMSEQGDHLGDMISERPVTTLASAFALGVVVGFTLRKH
jgi:ElaB/YqjD/DUF883 family membrane-anchored ribosome-binding protein